MDRIENVEHGMKLLYEIIDENRGGISEADWIEFKELAFKVADMAGRIYIDEIQEQAEAFAEAVESGEDAPWYADQWLAVQDEARGLAEALEKHGFIRDIDFEW